MPDPTRPPDPLALARALNREGSAEAEDALQAAISGPDGRYLLPSGKLGRSLPGALADWIARARRAGRPRTRPVREPGPVGRPRRPEGARKVGLVLSPAAAAAWDAHDGDRSAWVSALIEASVIHPWLS